MNPVAEKLTGWREDEALGRDVIEIFNTIDEETGRIPENIVTKALQGTIINPSDNTVLISSDGRKIPIDKSAAPIVDDKGNIIGAVLVFKDITERRIAEKTIKRRLEFEKTISNISSRFVGVFDMDFAINYSLREMGRLSGASRAYLFLFKEDRSIMEKTHEWCAEGVTPQMSCLRKLFSKKFPWWVEKINKGEVIHIDDVSKLPEEAKAEREMLKSQNIKSLIVLPLYIGDKPEGFIGFDNVIQTGRWSDEDLMLLCVFSGILGNAFERKRAEEELKRNFENLYKSMERTIHAMSKIFENTATKPSRFGRSPGI
jgi:PAS domain S-box-containing protein